MSEAGHDLRSVFPAHAAAIAQLKVESQAFHALTDRYHDVARTLHRIEAGLEPASDLRCEELKKERLRLLDEVSQLLRAEGVAA